MVKIINREPVAAAREPSGLEAGISLDTLKRGDAGTILQIQGDPTLKLHLMELGFVPGSAITFLMSTPFGDPNIYGLRGTSIALRKSEARCIRVRI